MNKHMTVEHNFLYIYIATCFELASSSSGKRQNISKKIIYKFNFLEMRSHFLHNMVTTYAFIFYTFKFFFYV